MKTNILRLILVLVFFGTLVLSSCNYKIQDKPVAEKGTIDLRSWDFKKGNVSLDGQWDFFWEKFVIYNKEDKISGYVNVPGTWNGKKIGGIDLPPDGYATYRLKVLLKNDLGPLALRIPYMSTAYRCYINGKLYASNGKAGSSKDESAPQYLNQTVNFYASGDVEIVIHVSNYSHRLSGLWDSIRIGYSSKITREREKAFAYRIFLLGSFIIMTFYHIALYLMRKKDKSTLYFAMICLVLSVRNISTGEVFLTFLFPDFPWDVHIRMEYISLFIVIPLAVYFFHELFPHEKFPYMKKTISVLSSVFIALTILLPPRYFTYSMIIWEPLTIVLVFYIAGILIKALINKREGALIAFFGSIILLTTVVLSVLHQAQLIRFFDCADFGLFTFILAQSAIMSLKFSRAFFWVEDLSQDLTLTNISYARFVPSQFLSLLNKDNIININIGDHIQKDMTVLFSDIRSFTQLSEAMSPNDNFKFINAYLKRMEPHIGSHGGFIDKYIGDGIMALYPRSACDAVNSAIDMQNAIIEYNSHRKNSGYPPINIGIGIHTGSLILGVIGGWARLDTTVIADAVNVASRVESLNKKFGSKLIITQNTYEGLKDDSKYMYRFLGQSSIKGKSDAVMIYEVFNSDVDKLRDLKVKTKHLFEEALHLYHESKTDGVRKMFREVLNINPDDAAAMYYYNSCEDFLNGKYTVEDCI